MSKVKSPAEKKRISLAKDRRNVYGECPTSSRKNIRRRKQLSHMELRRAAHEELRAVKGAATESDAEQTDARVKGRALSLSRVSVKRGRAAPLGEVIVRKRAGRSKRLGGRKRR